MILRRRTLCWLFLSLLLWSAEAAPPPGPPFFIALPPNTLATDVGAGGFVVAATSFNGGGLYWMPTVGTRAIGGTQAVAVSRDGKTILGNAFSREGFQNAAIWQGGTSWRLLGSISPTAQPCDRSLSSTYGASGDGKVVVGLGWDGCKIARAFRWEEATGVVSLGSLTGESTRANGISADGNVVVGWEEDVTGFRKAAKWVQGKEEFIQGPTALLGEAFAANDDGSLILGTSCNPFATTGPPAGWTWTAAAGVKCYAVTPPSWALPRPYQVLMERTSDDGRVMGGALSFGLDAEAVVWFDGEAFLLRDYLRSHGIPDAFDGWINTGFVTSVSPDGRTLVGYGAGPTTFQGYMVLLPALAKQ